MTLPADTSVGAVRLRVADLDASRAFYERVLGLSELDRAGEALALGPEGGPPLVELLAAPDAPRRPARSTGLFHLAILVPTRTDLARALVRVAGAGWRLTGASDHLVSEALYLDDPEGNGIEIYRDRPREQWPRERAEVQMATLPLNLDSLVGELGEGLRGPGANEMPAGTTIGHVHLQMSELAAAEAFYARALGFDVTVRSYPGALFVSAGGYHHHLGLNTWQSQGAPPPPDGALGLDRYELLLPSEAERDAAASRLADAAAGRLAGAEPLDLDEGVLVRDPSGNRVLLRAA
jgi:catechol 2,3-dioxygenase